MVFSSGIGRILPLLVIALFLFGIGCGGDDGGPETPTGGISAYAGSGGAGSGASAGTGGISTGSGGGGSVIIDAGRRDGSTRPTVVDAGRFDGGR